MIVGLFTELLGPGGVQTAGRQTAASLALAAARRNLPCRFLSLNDSAGSRTFSIRDAQIEFQGFGGNRVGFIIAAEKAAFTGASLAWAAHPNLAPVAAAMKLPRPRVKIIVCAHGVEVWTPLAPLRQFAMRWANAAVAPSCYTAEKLITEQHIAGSRVERLPWALDPAFEVAAALPNRDLLPHGLPAGPMILSVGRWSPDERYKGVDELMEAMPAIRAAIPDAFLAAVGNGDDRPRLEQRSAALGMQTSVRFFDAAQGAELVAYYDRCDVFALPSRGEGFGLVFLEAMALGKPLVGGAHGGIPDIISDGVNGFLVVQDDRDALASSLIELLRRPDLRQKMGHAGLERLRRDFLFETFSTRMEEILQRYGLPA
jgi:glycosyltransferase involved in cell wall biosynthesis